MLIQKDTVFSIECENHSYFFRIVSLFNQLSNNILDEMIKNIEKMNNIKMSDDAYFYISSIFEININNLKEVIDNCWRNVNYESRKHNKSI